ncbi:MAG TPA: Crp/Fnr family transcriptional regulator [Pyrinomonadaceae bacterium]|nr:Crp/Fnr family transcriptional regulator [Pyrinomonadaceae bacterium]
MHSRIVIAEKERDGAAQNDTSSSHNLVIPTHNFVLASLPPSDLNQIVSSAKAVEIKAGDVIYENGDEIDYIYFPINSIVSAVAIMEDGSTVEISMTGREGIVGIAALIGGGRPFHWTRVSVTGTALRVPTPTLQGLFYTRPGVSDGVLRAYRRVYTQICQRSVCNVRHTLLQRLATWLLMVSDRIGSEQLPFTQEQIAQQISVRRAGVSVAASHLQGLHAISYHRGSIVVKDRPVLEHMACECYEILGQEFGGVQNLRGLIG